MALPFLAAIAPTLIGSAVSAFSARSANKAREAEARRNREFQERMSSTAHQREVKDLRLAGLNPILSATGGRGAASPGGAMAPVESLLPNASASALAARRQIQELKNMEAQVGLIDAQTSVQRNIERIGAPAAGFADWTKSIIDFMNNDARGMVGSAYQWAKGGISSFINRFENSTLREQNSEFLQTAKKRADALHILIRKGRGE